MGVVNPGSWRSQRGASDVLASARASLKATPPRHKRRMSSIGGAQGNLDMGAFFNEMKGFKLRKVPNPEERGREKTRGGSSAGGEMQEVLRELIASLCCAFASDGGFTGRADPLPRPSLVRFVDPAEQAFKRKFAKAHDISSPMPNPRSGMLAHHPNWSSPRPAPAPPSTSAASARLPPPTQPTFAGSITTTTRPISDISVYSQESAPCAAAGGVGLGPPPAAVHARNHSTTVIGGALTTDAVRTHPSGSSLGASTMMSRSISGGSTESAVSGRDDPPPEPFAASAGETQSQHKPSPYLSSGLDFPLPPAASVSTLHLDQPPPPHTTSHSYKTPAKPSSSSHSVTTPASTEAASRRLSSVRKASNPTPPETRVLNYSRPITPGRKKALALREREQEMAREGSGEPLETEKEGQPTAVGEEREAARRSDEEQKDVEAEREKRESDRRKAVEKLEGRAGAGREAREKERISRGRVTKLTGGASKPRVARRVASAQPPAMPAAQSAFDSDDSMDDEDDEMLLVGVSAPSKERIIKRLRADKVSVSVSSFASSSTSVASLAATEVVDDDGAEEYFGVGTRPKDSSRVVGWGLSPGEDAEGGGGKTWARAGAGAGARREGGEWEGWALRASGEGEA